MLADIMILGGYTFAAWLIHIGFVGLYINKFSSVKSIGFRATHAVEIGLTVLIMLMIYKATQDEILSTTGIIITILATLIIVDGICFFLVKSLRERFDLYHFLTAYLVVALVAVLFSLV